MSKLSFYIICLLLLEMSVGNFHNYVFAEESEDDDQENESFEGEEETGENGGGKNAKRSNSSSEVEADDPRGHVKSIVDSILKINRHVDKPVRDSKSIELMKNHALSKQLSEIRQALNALGKAIGAKGINVPEVQKIQKDGKKKKHGKRRRSRGRHSSSYPSGVYTVKNVRSLNVDNGYACKTYDQFHGKKHFSTTPHMEEREYKIKLFGNGRSAEVVSGSFRNFTNKRGKSSCISSSGCSV